MTLVDAVGIVASIIVLSAFLPQVVKSYRTKKMDDISYYLMVI